VALSWVRSQSLPEDAAFCEPGSPELLEVLGFRAALGCCLVDESRCGGRRVVGTGQVGGCSVLPLLGLLSLLCEDRRAFGCRLVGSLLLLGGPTLLFGCSVCRDLGVDCRDVRVGDRLDSVQVVEAARRVQGLVLLAGLRPELLLGLRGGLLRLGAGLRLRPRSCLRGWGRRAGQVRDPGRDLTRAESGLKRSPVLGVLDPDELVDLFGVEGRDQRQMCAFGEVGRPKPSRKGSGRR
jgi:hypothetical protein